MDTDPVHWLPGSFFRKPEWRWLRAEYLVATGRRLDPRIDDDWVALVRTALAGGRGDRSKAAAVTAARGVRAGDPAVWGELEARLLTEEPLDPVAERFVLPVTVIEAYEAAFFAVRPMRRATDWLLTRAVGYRPLRGFTRPQPTATRKLAAVAGGALLLDVVVAATSGRPLPAGCLTGAGPRRSYADARIRLLADLWARSMAATTDEEFARVAKAHRQLRDLDARVAGHPADVPAVVLMMEQLLDAVGRRSRAATAGVRGGPGEASTRTSARAGGTDRPFNVPRPDEGRLDWVIDRVARTPTVSPVGDPDRTPVAARVTGQRLPGATQGRRLAG